MAVFGLADENTLDYQILRDGGVSLYRSLVYLEEDLQWLQERRYLVYRIDCTGWASEAALHETFKAVLSFPSYYGRNRNALRDCMQDLNIPEDGGVAIVLLSYHLYALGLGSELTATRRAPSGETAAEGILDILAASSRCMLLTGLRLITLVQSDDPSLQFENLGGTSATWNRREWLNKDRGLGLPA